MSADKQHLKEVFRFVRRSVKFDTEITYDELFKRVQRFDRRVQPFHWQIMQHQILQFLTGMCGFKKSHRKKNGAIIYVSDQVPYKKPNELGIARDSPAMNFYRDLAAGKYSK